MKVWSFDSLRHLLTGALCGLLSTALCLLAVVPAQAQTITISSGNNQTGQAGTTLANPLVVRVKGRTGGPLVGVTVTFAVTSGGGSLSAFSANTAGNGTASTQLTLGPAAGINTVSATAANVGSVSFTETALAGAAPATKLALTPVSANTQTGAAISYTATIQDANSNTATTATNPITFSASGVSGSFNPASPLTPTNGIAGRASRQPRRERQVTASSSGLTSATATLAVSTTPTGSQSLFTTQTPAIPNASDGVPYELGMKFRLARAGQISAIRYWKASIDSGTHVGRIWSANGTELAAVTFSGETASGWQQQSLSTALPVQANTSYVVSVNVASHFSVSDSGLANTIVNGDISSMADGANGVFGSAFAFPTNSFHNSNYFRDIVFTVAASSAITKVSGDNQNGTPGQTLSQPLVVLVRDANNTPLPNVTVSFVVSSGTGSVAPGSAVTNASGQASTTLTLGPSGQTTVSATAAGIGSVTFGAVVQNAIYFENQKPGTTAWKMSNPVTASTPEIAGYASATSVNKGGSLPFKITLAQTGQYTIAVYRLGYYAGQGGRLMGIFGPFSGGKQSACNVVDTTTRLIECNWTTSFTLQVGSDWTSGLYLANLTAQSSGKQSQIWFVVRDDQSRSDLLFQSSFTTFQAYNNHGDAERRSLYDFNSTNGQRAFKVSFDRPFGQVTVEPERYEKLTTYERNMARWLESQSYDVSYVSNLDVHTNPNALLQHKAFLSVGHDEYWSLEMRNAIEQARDAGINLGFFTANAGYWRVRFEPSPTTGEPNRVMVCYKDPLAGDPIAPTYLWRGPENNRPENALMGIMYVGDDVFDMFGGYDYIVSNAADPYYNNTGFSNNAAASRLVGFEWDAVVNNGFTPNGLVILSQSRPTARSIAPNLPPGTNSSISNAVRYTAASGAKVFATGSIQFAWGLDSDGVSPARADPRIKQFVINILANMGARPLTPDAGLVVP